MEDGPDRLIAALSTHAEGLEAALASLGMESAAEVSIRRISRSLLGKARALNASEIVLLTAAVLRAPASELGERVRDLLGHIRERQSGLEPAGEAHILVIEDNPMLAAALIAYLKMPGRVVHAVATAAEAEKALAARSMDLILLDLILPDRDGRDLLVQLRERESTAAVPVIVLSAQDSAVARVESLTLGANEFIEKPADPKSLRAAVARQLARAEAVEDPRTDAVTGLLNRSAMLDAFEQARADGGTNREGAPTAVAIVDLDELETVNDTLGHDAGDRFLTTTAQELATGIEALGVAGRWGGDQFALFACQADEEDLRQVLGAALSRLSDGKPDDFAEVGLEMSFCAGVGPALPGLSLKESLLEAGKALLVAKGQGHGRVVTIPDVEAGEGRTPAVRVLLVEDDRTTATLIEHRLAREGFDIVHHTDGDAAFRVASEGGFDLAIFDVKIPGMDGFALVKQLRAVPSFGKTPVLMLTGMGSEADVVRGLSLGANDYMLKPFSPSELVARVRRLAALPRSD